MDNVNTTTADTTAPVVETKTSIWKTIGKVTLGIGTIVGVAAAAYYGYQFITADGVKAVAETITDVAADAGDVIG